MSGVTTRIIGRFDRYLLLTALALLSSARIWLLRDPVWDDNCWLQNIYATDTLQDFLAMGFFELRRVPLGVAAFPLLTLHKSSQNFYLAWHLIDMLTEICSPILLYLLIRNLFPEKRLLAVFTASGFTAFHLDHTLGYVSSLNYHVGLLLTLLSFYLTERGVSRQTPRYGCMLGAIVASGIVENVFIEAAVALEPARLLLIGAILWRNIKGPRVVIRRALALWSPFFLLSVPLVLYKLLYKPYGIYTGVYSAHPKPHQVLKNLAALFYFEGIELVHSLQYWNFLSLALGLGAAALSFWFLSSQPSTLPASFKDALRDSLRSDREALWLGLVFLIPPMALYVLFDRPLGGNMNSNHATLLQIGSSILLGTVLSCLYGATSALRNHARLVGLSLLAGMIGMGIFMNNKYLDLYFQSWQEQTRFWEAFITRFPSLPDQATFFVDVDDGTHFSDLKIYYDFEFQINLLYARSTRHEEFHRYRVYTLEEWEHSEGNRQPAVFTQEIIPRLTHFGMEVLDPRNFIAIRYRKGQLLVNGEIMERYHDVPYRAWLDKRFPSLPPQPPLYVFRDKLEAFN